MALSRLLVGWALVAGWLLAWDAVTGRIGSGPPSSRATILLAVGEALLLALLGGLWFASLGAGGWWLVFALVGGLREWPAAVPRARPRAGRVGVVMRLLRVLRIVAAGGLLAWWLAA